MKIQIKALLFFAFVFFAANSAVLAGGLSAGPAAGRGAEEPISIMNVEAFQNLKIKRAVKLEDTKIGRSLFSGDIESWRKNFNDLTHKNENEILSVLQAIDERGNNIFHWMAKAAEKSAEFSGEILRAVFFFLQLEESSQIILNFLIQKNNEGLAPAALAGNAGRSSALEYLLLAEKLIKNHRKRYDFEHRIELAKNINTEEISIAYYNIKSYKKLEESSIYSFLKKGELAEWRKAFNEAEKFENRISFLSMITRSDKNENNILHLIAKASAAKPEFAGEALRLIAILAQFENYKDTLHSILFHKNNEGFSPSELAEKINAEAAFDYLRQAENTAKRIYFTKATAREKDLDRRANQKPADINLKPEQQRGKSQLTDIGELGVFIAAGIAASFVHSETGLLLSILGIGGSCYSLFKKSKKNEK